MKKILNIFIITVLMPSCQKMDDNILSAESEDLYWQNTLCVRRQVPELKKILTFSANFPYLGYKESMNEFDLEVVLNFLGPRLKDLLSKSYLQNNLDEYTNFNKAFEIIYLNIGNKSIKIFDLLKCKNKKGYGENEILASFGDSFGAMLNIGSKHESNNLDIWFLSLNKKGVKYKYDLFWVLISMAAADKYEDMGKILELFSKTNFK